MRRYVLGDLSNWRRGDRHSGHDMGGSLECRLKETCLRRVNQILFVPETKQWVIPLNLCFNVLHMCYEKRHTWLSGIVKMTQGSLSNE